MKKAVGIVICTALFMLLSGCFDYNELNMQEIVSGVGIDVSEEKVTVSVQTAGTDKESDSRIYVSEGGSFFDAVRAISESAGKKLYWGHCRVAVLSEKALPRALGEICDAVFRSQDVFPDISVLCAVGSTAEDVISSSPSGRGSAEIIYDTLANAENSRRFKDTTVWEIMRDGAEYGVCMLPCVSVTKNGDEKSLKIAGGAVVFGESKTEILSGGEVLALSLLCENGAGGYLPPLETGDNGKASLEILENDVKREVSGERLKAEIKCVLAPGELLGRPDNSQISAAAEEYIKTTAEKLVSRAEESGFQKILKVREEFSGADISCRAVISNVRGGGQ